MAYEIAKPRIIKWLLEHAYRFTDEMMEKIVAQVHRSYCKQCENTEKSMPIEHYLDAIEYVAFNGKSFGRSWRLMPEKTYRIFNAENSQWCASIEAESETHAMRRFHRRVLCSPLKMKSIKGGILGQFVAIRLESDDSTSFMQKNPKLASDIAKTKKALDSYK